MIPTEFEFKSNHKYFYIEAKGTKNNTVREIDLQDERFLDLIYWMQVGWNDGDIKIKIVNEEKSFVRDITDISIWKNLMIITWKV